MVDIEKCNSVLGWHRMRGDGPFTNGDPICWCGYITAIGDGSINGGGVTFKPLPPGGVLYDVRSSGTQEETV